MPTKRSQGSNKREDSPICWDLKARVESKNQREKERPMGGGRGLWGGVGGGKRGQKGQEAHEERSQKKKKTG